MAPRYSVLASALTIKYSRSKNDKNRKSSTSPGVAPFQPGTLGMGNDGGWLEFFIGMPTAEADACEICELRRGGLEGSQRCVCGGTRKAQEGEGGTTWLLYISMGNGKTPVRIVVSGLFNRLVERKRALIPSILDTSHMLTQPHCKFF